MVALKAPRDLRGMVFLRVGGRPVGTTAEKGYGVGTSGGRPVGTTAEKGYGTGGGRLPDYKVGKHIEFRGIDLPDKWDTQSKDKINLPYWNAVPVLCNRDVLTRSH